MQFSESVQNLLASFEESHVARDGSHLTVSRTVSVLAVIYEKIRNAVEFRADHLIRRAAIERILKRRILLNGGSSNIAENVITELLWARYIDSAIIDQAKIAEIQSIIERYLSLKHTVFHNKNQHDGIEWDTIVGVASSEIEETIVSARKRLSLNAFFYYAIRPKISIPDHDEQYSNALVYIAVEKAYSQSDKPIILHHIVQMITPDWFDVTKSGTEMAFISALKTAQSYLTDKTLDRLTVFVRRQMPPFLLLRDFLFDDPKRCREIIEKPEEFEHKLTELAQAHYKETGSKVRRAIVRSFLYILLTKMVFAFILEYPYDAYIAKRVSFLALGINAIFPPVLLVLVAGFISVPGAENTKRLIDRINKIIYHFDSLKDETDHFSPTLKNRRPILTTVFTILLIGMYALTFIAIRLILSALHFSIASQIIFVFFVALVTFFAYRIRHSAKEYEMVEHQGILEPVMDFFFLPILRAGQILSSEIAKINVLIFLFDFILEAPLKVIFEVTEEWTRFVRNKKDEII